MLSDCKMIAFAATAKAEEALTFYRDRLGLTLVEESEYAIVFAGGGTMLRLQRVAAFEPQPFTVLGWNVPDIRGTVAALGAAGINVERFDFMQLDEAGIWWTPGGDGIAWFKDPDGNTLSLTQFAAS